MENRSLCYNWYLKLGSAFKDGEDSGIKEELGLVSETRSCCRTL